LTNKGEDKKKEETNKKHKSNGGEKSKKGPPHIYREVGESNIVKNEVREKERSGNK